MLTIDANFKRSTTVAHHIEQLGDLDAARAVVREEIAISVDVVRRRRLARSLVSLAAEACDWNEVQVTARGLLDDGEHEPFLYLHLDDALAAHRAPEGDRLTSLRESAERWNRSDIDTQLRWVQLLGYNGQWSTAAGALLALERVAAKMGLPPSRRDVGWFRFRRSLYHAEERVFEGVVKRMSKTFEGEAQIEGLSILIQFRADRASVLSVGSRIRGKMSVRMRGFLLVDVEVVDAGSPSSNV